MKINNISWTNYKGLADGAVDACGNNVTISGRNGAGKSSIASILPFILFGKGTDSVKHYDDGHAPTDDGLIHAAEVTFDDGQSFRREFFWENDGNRNALYINGAEVSTTAFKAAVEGLTHGAGEFVINPFALHELPANEQREILMRTFATVNDSDLLADEFPQLVEHLNGQSVDVFINRAKNQLKSLKAEAAQIPALIEENQRRIDSDNINNELSTVEQELEVARSEYRQLSQACDYNHELALAQKRLGELARQQNRYAREHSALKSRRQSLLAKHKRACETEDICPTCGQPLPANFQAKRKAHIADIVTRGKQCRLEIDEHEKILADIDEERRAVENQIARLQSDSQTQKDRVSQLQQLNAQIEQRIARKIQLESQKAAADRIQTLHNDELNLIRQIDDLKRLLADAKFFRRRKIELVEDSINRHFARVKFKLFDYLISTGEVKPTCEATLNGVPYKSLSKGEQLRAALDTFRTLQTVYGVELPVMLDDAEAYTSNSRVDIPNQIFAFKVTDDDLNIRVVTGCATNAA